MLYFVYANINRNKWNKIFMNYQFNEHNPPHIHGVRGNNRCSVDLDGNILKKGRMSSKDIKIVIDYILNNKNDLKNLSKNQQEYPVL